jgi:hypothetical protein
MGMRPDQPWNEDALTDACRTFLFRFNWFSECRITRGQARTQSSVTMGVKIVKTINDRDRKRRVEIYKRSDGSFGFAEWQFGTEEQSWYPVGRYSHAIIDTLENAEKEARSRVRWLADEAEER